ncbi:MAG TPA: glycosyltransferase family 1 protein [Thermodesulfobacteriaceae bacterium]|nr:glycosyltransferase family 1 protein [Thermodesulfobacteriaceae bacterium]
MADSTNQSTVVAFIHTYRPDGRLDSYMSELVDAFVRCGIRLHLVITNHIVPNLDSTALKKHISEQRLIEYINDVDPEFIFTTNRGGITKGIMEKTHAPILTWMVDHTPFFHHGGGPEDLFCEKDHCIISSLRHVKVFESTYPVLKGRVHYLPFATKVEDFKTSRNVVQDVDISFVGTYFHSGILENLYNYYADSPETIQGLLRLAGKIQSDPDTDILPLIEAYGIRKVLEDFNYNHIYLKWLFVNYISLNQRIKVLDAVSDLGLRLYGTDNWLHVGAYSLNLLGCFQFQKKIDTRQKLVELYQRSRIGLNISHHQAGGGLPYRIFDLLASNALLVTNARKDSDLFHLFGEDVQVPMYKNEQDLRKIVIYYLENEKERRELVQYCNRLVDRGFSFEDRVRSFFEIAGCRLKETGHGQLVKVDPDSFIRGLVRYLYRCGGNKPYSSQEKAAPAGGDRIKKIYHRYATGKQRLFIARQVVPLIPNGIIDMLRKQ